ncbi:MAG: pantoate--beta-alanine ligase [Actinomycetia bacterium]|nr:pantoate--beta-alanine ligase [Actinomycetes bacterium]
MEVITTIAGLREELYPRRAHAQIALVPTMGALHAGHLALIEAARTQCELVVISLFVNPTQFGSAADFDCYPRTLERDGQAAEAAGVDYLFAPSTEEVYPAGFQTQVEVADVSRGMEGAARPGHFGAVATICLKLFNIVQPDRAYFGRKDAQQAAVVIRMVHDLDIDVDVRIVPTVRDTDGLALSSRNVHLTQRERQAALALPEALAAGRAAHALGGDPVGAAREALTEAVDVVMDYVDTMRLNGQSLLAGSITVGSTRLIDNVILDPGAQEVF